MRLSDLLTGRPIAVQCHDAPDPDALASAYALHCYLDDQGMPPYLFYGGRAEISKPNLKLMRELFEIPVEHRPDLREWEGLLVTVDCQYGNSNVQAVSANTAAVIDHHLPGDRLPPMSRVNPSLGSCATLVWTMLQEEGFDIGPDRRTLALALYYGLYADTNAFAEIRHPVDLNMRDALTFHDPQMIIQEEPHLKLLLTSNLSLDDLRIAFTALHNIRVNREHEYALIESEPCDQNLLGFMSDLAVQVDGINTVVAWTRHGEGWKYSVRTSGRMSRAIDVAGWLAAEGAGHGGGHKEKGGGFILERSVREIRPGIDGQGQAFEFFKGRLEDYCTAFTIVDRNRPLGKALLGSQAFKKKDIVIGYVPSASLFESGTRLCLRMLEGDTIITADEDIIIVIGLQAEVYFMSRQVFENSYIPLGQGPGSYQPVFMPSYEPTVSAMTSAERIPLLAHARRCRTRPDGRIVRAGQAESRIKLFPSWDNENYLTAEPGDWLVHREDSGSDLYVIKKKIFPLLYEFCEPPGQKETKCST